MDKIERIRDCLERQSPPDINKALSILAKLEAALDKRLRQEYMDEDHRLGGIGITFEEFRKIELRGEHG